MPDAQGTGDRLLLDDKDNPWGLRLTLHREGLECRAALPQGARQPLSFSDLRQTLQQAGVVQGLQNEALTAFCERSRKEGKLPPTLVASGTAPAKGADGHFAMNTLRSMERLQQDEAGRVDLRSLNPLDNVTSGQEVGRLHPPTQGEDGQAVTGATLPGLLGTPLPLVCGEGAELDPDSGLVHATRAGRVLFDGKTVKVAEDYVVSGNVDYAVGNIRFHGLVRISGDVLDGFDVHALKEIKVGGTIGACQIACDGNITAGGVSGQGRGVIRCGGTLKARYLIDVTVECDGDVVVESEIRNCTIKARGQVLVTGGFIVGGECVALGGIEVKQLGAPQGARTRIFGGIDYDKLDRLRALKQQMDGLQQEIAGARRVLDSIRQRAGAGEEAPPALQHMTKRHENLVLRRAQLEMESNDLRRLDDDAVLQVNVRETLFEKVVVTIGFATETYNAELSGPLSIIRIDNPESLRVVDMMALGSVRPGYDEDTPAKWGA